jgi:large subunit ribosomal protein L5
MADKIEKPAKDSAAEPKTEKKTAPKAEKAAEPKTEKASAPKAEKAAEPKAEKKSSAPKEKYVPRLRAKYDKEVKKALMEEFKYSSPMALPKVERISVNMGVGEAINDKNILDAAADELSLIAGQHAVKTLARKSISNFKLRQGMPIGARVTLRGDRMYDFLDKLIAVALPRVRDFNGLKMSSFDGRGNYSMGLKEQIVFPEIDYDKISKVRGMDITIVTTAKTDEEAYKLLSFLGMPFKEK